MQMMESKEQVAPESTPPPKDPVNSPENIAGESSPRSEEIPSAEPSIPATDIPPNETPLNLVPIVNIGISMREEGEAALITASSLDVDSPVMGPRSVSRKDLGSAILQLFGEFLPILKAHLAKPKPVPTVIQKPAPAVKPGRPQSRKPAAAPKAPPSFIGSQAAQPNAPVTQGAFSF